jgi:hypothetical protein
LLAIIAVINYLFVIAFADIIVVAVATLLHVVIVVIVVDIVVIVTAVDATIQKETFKLLCSLLSSIPPGPLWFAL